MSLPVVCFQARIMAKAMRPRNAGRSILRPAHPRLRRPALLFRAFRFCGAWRFRQPLAGNADGLAQGRDRARPNQPGGAQLLDARQIGRYSARPKCNRKASVVTQVTGRPAVCRRPLGAIQPASISMSSVPLLIDDAADLFDLGPRHRLVIGDDRERLDRGARQFASDLLRRASDAAPDRARCAASSRPRRARY